MAEILESIDVVGNRPGVDRRGDEVLTSIDVFGKRKGDEVLTDIDVVGTRPGGNGPSDGERLENTVRPMKKHLYYPQELSDAQSMYKNAVQFKVYVQTRSFQDDPGETPYIKEIPTQYRSGSRTFPVSFGAFNLSLTNRLTSLVGGFNIPGIGRVPPNAGQIAEDLYGIGAYGLSYFFQGERTNYGRRTQQIDNSITLYMPDMMVNTDKHDYQPISINQAAGRAGLYTAGAPTAVGGTGSPLGRTEVLAELAGRAGIFGSRSTEAVLAGLGYAMNPMLEMVYGGTQPRTFTFQFRFAPRNMKEAEEVLNIIKTFRFHSHSESAGRDADPMSKGSGTRYLVPPNHFEITFLRRVNGRFQENISMPRVTTCMLAQVNTNYAAQLDSFTTFRDGKPVSISMELEFIESVVLTKNDIRMGY